MYPNYPIYATQDPATSAGVSSVVNDIHFVISAHFFAFFF